jgi:uncharacterized protein YjgD (DUF1641 family)
MSENNIQIQVNEVNEKLDLLLNYVNEQRLKSQAIEDLLKDVSIIGKDIFNDTVVTLEEQQVSINPDEIKLLAIKFFKNIDNFHKVMSLFESASDFVKDAEPIFNEVMIDAVKSLHKYEQKGYFQFFSELMNVVDNIVKHFTKEDIKNLSENVVPILETVKNITQPEMMKAFSNGINTYKNINLENIPSMSIWKLVRELNTPEMKKGLGFMVTFLKKINEK